MAEPQPRRASNTAPVRDANPSSEAAILRVLRQFSEKRARSSAVRVARWF